MPYQFDTLADQKVLRLTFSGAVTVNERAAALEAFVEQVEATGCNRVLVDFRNGWTVPTDLETSQRHAAKLAAEYAALDGARIAYVSHSGKRPASPVELLAASRGYFYQRFADPEPALRWLLA